MSLLRLAACFVVAASVLSARCERLFLKLDGIDGESTEERHAKWIEVESFDSSVQKLPGSRPAFSPLALSKPMDISSPVLANRCWSGRAIAHGSLEVLRPIQTGMARLLQVNLTNILVVSFQQSGANGVVSDNFSLEFGIVEWVYTQIDPRGGAGTEIRCRWNRLTGTGAGGNDGAGGGGGEDLDSDGDGLPLSYEQLYGLDPARNDANGDLDGDGATNLQEFRAGTLPNRADSVFRMVGRRFGVNQVELLWTPIEGRSYKLFAAPDADGPFAEVGPVDPGAGGRLLFDASRLRQFFIIEAQ